MTEQPADRRGVPSPDPDGRLTPDDQPSASHAEPTAPRSPWAAPLGAGSQTGSQTAWGSEAAPNDEMASSGEAAASREQASSDQTSSDREVTQEYSPVPEPRSEWARVAAGSLGPSTPEAWFEQPVTRVVNVPPRRTWPLSLLLSVSMISAVLASGGTFLALNASGVLNRPSPGASAPGSQAPQQQVSLEESSAVIAAAQKVSPAVVKITSSASANQADPNALPDTGIGSGVVYDPSGWILTNRHVVAGSDALTVRLKDGRELPGRIYGYDTLTDLAIVKIEASNLPTAPVGDSSKLKVGQLAIAIGSPLGTYTNTVTSGIVSAMGREIQLDNGNTIHDLIQTDTAINPGNSGGPLLDSGGNVIGINTAVARNAQGIGFAIPINIARPIMDQALAGQKLARPWLGIRYQAVDPQLQKDHKLAVDHGAWVTGGESSTGQSTPAIVANSPAEKAGIKDGDVIVRIEGIDIDSEHPLESVLVQFPPGRMVTVEVLRDGQTLKLQVTLGTRPADL
jgi:serine protease Do